MIKNIIFDMGQVLIKFDPEYFIDRLGIKDPKDREMLMRTVFRSLEWSRLDRGSLTDEEAVEIMRKKVPERLYEAVRELVEWYRPVVPVEGMEALVRELKDAGYRLYLLSNACLKQKDYWPDYPASALFDGRVVSSEEGLVKPQPEIYRLLLSRYGLEPSECVFIDDSTPNAEAAYYCGMQAIVFHGDVSEIRSQLSALGVKLK